MQLPEHVKTIIRVLEEHGFEAYAVGGCVRDALLCKEPNDWDITTNASPQKIKQLFSRTVDTGIAHGTVTVLMGRESYEVTTYRIDGVYEDGRHPREVTFTSDLLEDLKRRDFTINAMAYNDRVGLVDCFDGAGDLKRGVIRCVGEAAQRFTEDALRILRCLRFSAQLGFFVEEQTANAAQALAPNLKKISAERIQVEWTKLLCSQHPDRMLQAEEYGILQQFYPEIHTSGRLADAVANAAPQKALRFAMFFCEQTPQTARRLLRRLKFDNETIRTASALVSYLHKEVACDAVSVRMAVSEIGERLFPLLLSVWDAYRLAGYEDAKTKEELQLLQKLYEEIRARGDCLSLGQLAVDGSDLIAAGILPGKEMGNLLQKLLLHVLRHPEDNTKEQLLKQLK